MSRDEDRVDQLRAEVRKEVEGGGWMVIGVLGDQRTASMAYTVGLFRNFEHPELVLTGLDIEVMHTILNDLSSRVKAGETFEDGTRDDRVFAGYPAAFRRVGERMDALHVARSFYRGMAVPALQVFYPDRGGLLPWESGYALPPEAQPSLAAPMAEREQSMLQRQESEQWPQT